jgi:hypothetical protein
MVITRRLGEEFFNRLGFLLGVRVRALGVDVIQQKGQAIQVYLYLTVALVQSVEVVGFRGGDSHGQPFE